MENRFRFLESVTENLYFDEWSEDVIYDRISYNMKKKKINFKQPNFYSGCTKVCFDWQDLPYVIKCSFKGKRFYDCDEETGEEYPEVEDFNCDSCEDELTMYEDFKSKEIEMFFAETWAAPPNHSKFICAEKVIPICNDEWDKSHKPSRDLTKQEVASVTGYYPPFDKEWINNCIIHYGIEKTVLFLETCLGEDWMDDMHRGNYGYNEKEEPKILDWGGINNV